MSVAERVKELSKLSRDERLEIVTALWDTIADDDLPEMTDEEKAIIDERLDRMEREPRKGTTLEELRKEIEARYGP